MANTYTQIYIDIIHSSIRSTGTFKISKSIIDARASFRSTAVQNSRQLERLVFYSSALVVL